MQRPIPARVISPPVSPTKVASRHEKILEGFTLNLGARLSINKKSGQHEQHSSIINVLPFLSNQSVSKFPSLSMFRGSSSSPRMKRKFSQVKNNVDPSCSLSAEELAIHNLSYSLEYGIDDISSGSPDMALNTSSSFASLVAANIRQYLKINVFSEEKKAAQSKKARDLAGSFFRSKGNTRAPISLESVSTSFLSATVGKYVMQQMRNDVNTELFSDEMLVLPLGFQVEITVRIFEEKVKVFFIVPGSIAASFSMDNNNLIERTEISLDTAQLLSSMRHNARLVAWKFISAQPSCYGISFPKITNQLPVLTQGRSDTPPKRIISSDSISPSTSSMTVAESSPLCQSSPIRSRKRLCPISPTNENYLTSRLASARYYNLKSQASLPTGLDIP